MTISIIIAVKTWQKNSEESVRETLGLNFPDFEILVVPDEELTSPYEGITVIASGKVPPAAKRDLAASYAKGEILAFLDDDAYPDREWLNYAAERFKDPEIAAVAGPAVTPDSDSLRQKASGMVYESPIVSGNYRYRYKPLPERYVEDYPSCNLFIRKDVFNELGGFDTLFWPGEDTKLCLEVVKKLGKKIIYDPKVLVYHHRRPLFLPHLKQIKSYATHRGYFVKKFPQTSFRFAYFLPSIFTIALIAGLVLSTFSPVLWALYIYSLALYGALVLCFSLKKALRLSLLVFAGTVLTHLTYGLWFIRGLFARGLSEEREVIIRKGTVPEGDWP